MEEEGGINLYGFVQNNAVNYWDYLGQTGSGSSYPNPPPWPEFPEEGEDCSVPPAELTKLNLEIALSATWTRYNSVNVTAWVDWEIEGTYISPQWNYRTCYRPGGVGHLAGCDNGNCSWLAGEPQLTWLRFHYLSCECEVDESMNPTGKTVWTRKRYQDFAVINGEQRWFRGGWDWTIEASNYTREFTTF